MTAASPTAGQLFEIRCSVFTTLGKFEGILATDERRLSDAVNQGEQDFLLLQSVETSAFSGRNAQHDAIVAFQALFARRNILLVTSRQSQATGPGSSPLYLPKSSIPSLIQAGHWMIRGTLHLPPTAQGLDGLTDPQRGFVPITNAHVTQDLDEDSAFDVPLVLANKNYVDMVVEASRLKGLLTSVADGIGRVAEPFPTDPAVVATLLGATPLFSAIDRSELQEHCGRLVADGSIRGLRLPRGWRPVSQAPLAIRSSWCTPAICRWSALSRDSPNPSTPPACSPVISLERRHWWAKVDQRIPPAQPSPPNCWPLKRRL